MSSKRKSPKRKKKVGFTHEATERQALEKAWNEFCTSIKENPTILDSKNPEQLLIIMGDAAAAGRDDDVRELLKRGVDPNGIQPEGHSCLHAAARYGHINVVRVLLEAGADADTRGPLQDTPLHSAAAGGHYEVLRELLKAGADPNGGGELEFTPLQVSILKLDINSVSVLLDHGADPNAQIAEGVTGLMIACGQGILPVQKQLQARLGNHSGSNARLRIVEALIKAGANVNSVADDGNSPLKCAIAAKSLERVKLLLDHGARIDTLHLIAAAVSDNVDILEILIQHYSDIIADPELAAEMMIGASGYGNPMVVEALLGHGFDPNIRDPEGNTPLTQAVATGKQENVRVLLEHGADPNLPGPGAKIPLCLADAATAAILLDKGADLEVVDDVAGRSVLHWATENEHTDRLKFFLERGANTEVLDKDGYTPLVLAALNGKFKAVKILVNAGANVNHLTPDGRTAVDLAAGSTEKDIRNFLRDRGGLTGKEIQPDAEMSKELQDQQEFEQLVASEMFAAATEGDLERLMGAMLVADDLDIRDDRGRTPFMVAVLNGHLELADLLIDEGADINANDGRGYNALTIAKNLTNERAIEYLTAKGCEVQEIGVPKRKHKAVPGDLFTAAGNGNVKATKLLLEEGHDPNKFDPRERNTPLLLAVKDGHTKIVQLLLEHGADPDLCDQGNLDTPLIIASREGLIEIVGLLIQAGADVNKQGYQGVTALMRAAEKLHWNIVQRLLDAGAKITLTDTKGRDACFFAAKRNDRRQLDDMLAKQARERPAETASAWPWYLQEEKKVRRPALPPRNVGEALSEFYADYLSKLSALEKSAGGLRRESWKGLRQTHPGRSSVLEKTLMNYMSEWLLKEVKWP